MEFGTNLLVCSMIEFVVTLRQVFKVVQRGVKKGIFTYSENIDREQIESEREREGARETSKRYQIMRIRTEILSWIKYNLNSE